MVHSGHVLFPPEDAASITYIGSHGKAAGERHSDGDIERSIKINVERFHISEELTVILMNTAKALWPKEGG